MAVQSIYPAGVQTVSPPLTGAELVDIDNGGAVKAQTTTAAIAELASTQGGNSNSNVTAATGTTLTAAQLLSGLVNRTGPTAVYSDATPTAAALVALSSVGASFYFSFKNGTAFNATLTAGSGITLPTSVIVPPNSVGRYLVVLNTATTATVYHVGTGPLSTGTLEVVTALNTVGAGTITAAGIVGGVTTRGGAQSNTAFTDTTGTAAAIIAAQPNAHIGDSWEWTYQNGTDATATVQGGTGVTVSGITAVPSGASARYLVTYTAAATVTAVGFLQTAPSGASGTFTANEASAVTVADTRVTANSVVSFGLKTVGGTPAGAPFMATVTPGTGFTVKSAVGDTSVYNYRIVG